MDMFDDLLGSAGNATHEPAPLPGELDEKGMAALMRLSLPQIRTKAREGHFVRSSRGRYNVAESLGRYIEHLRSVASRSGGRPSVGGDDLRAEKLRLTRAQADKEEARVARERGEMVAITDVRAEWVTFATDLRSQILPFRPVLRSVLG